MLKTKLFTAIALVAALMLLAPAAYADTGGETSGSFGAKAKPPVVSDLEIYVGTPGPTYGDPLGAGSMDPQATYYAQLTVTCLSKLKHLETVQATIYYDEDGSDSPPVGGGDTQKLAILTWTAATDTFSIDSGGGSTTWSLEAGSTHPADLNDTTGDWQFFFKPGKVATEAPSAAHVNAEWDAEGLAIDKTPTESNKTYLADDKGMTWFGEIDIVSSGTIDWGPVDLGLTFDDAVDNPQTDIEVNYIANGDYYEDIASEDWDDGALPPEVVALVELDADDAPPAGDGEFALKAYWDNVLGSAQKVPADSSYAHIKSTEGITSEDGNAEDANTLWLSLSASGIYPGTYTGSIWYQIAERNP